MSLGFGFKLNLESLQEEANKDISAIEAALIDNPLRSGTLEDFLLARTRKEFFQGIVGSINPEYDFFDQIEYRTRPTGNFRVLSRSTSVLSNMLEDLRLSLQLAVHEKVLDRREREANKAAEAAKKA